MILYTMMPNELVYPQAEQDFPVQKVIEYNGVTLAVSQTSDFNYRIERVLSTDPQHYMQQNYAPGQRITMSDYI